MDDSAPWEWRSLKYQDPETILIGLREIMENYPVEVLDYDVASLRRRDVRQYGEGRQAALFCYGMSQRLQLEIHFAQHEARDHDVIARYIIDRTAYHVPVQLKEWVPETLSPKSRLQSEIDKLEKYKSAEDLVVAFHLNRNAQVNFSELQPPRSSIMELWFFGAKDETQEEWWLLGNLMSGRMEVHEFEYPRA